MARPSHQIDGLARSHLPNRAGSVSRVRRPNRALKLWPTNHRSPIGWSASIEGRSWSRRKPWSTSAPPHSSALTPLTPLSGGGGQAVGVSQRARCRRYSPIESSANPTPTTIASGASPAIDMMRVASRTVPNVQGASRQTMRGAVSSAAWRTGSPIEMVCSTPLRSQTSECVVVVQAMASH